MNGLEKITDRIAADAKAEADAILADAQAQAQAIAAEAEAAAAAEAADILAKGEKAAAERGERIASMAQLEGRKRILAAKQEMLIQAFDKALLSLLARPKAEQIDLLANMAAKAAVTGRESVMFNAEDQKEIGKAVVAKANELLTKGAATLTLSDQTRPITGGFVLESGGVEINCAYETLVRLSRSELERQVAKVLFDA